MPTPLVPACTCAGRPSKVAATSAPRSPSVAAYCIAVVVIVAPLLVAAAGADAGRLDERQMESSVARSVAFAAELTAHLQPDVRVRVLAQALAAHDHIVRAGDRDLRKGRNNQGGGKRHNADERLHVTSPCCGTFVRTFCATAESRLAPRLLSATCHRSPARGCEGGHTTAKKELFLLVLIGSR